jgi:hypothetical protein
MFQALLAHLQKVLQQTALGILRVCYVSWLHQDWSGAIAYPSERFGIQKSMDAS